MSYRSNGNWVWVQLLLILLVLGGSLWYEGSVIYHCHQTKGTLVRSYWTKLPKCVEDK